MTNITFQSHRLTDFTRPLTVENAFRTFFNFGQIHSQAFDTAYAMASSNWIATGNPGTGITDYTVDEQDLFLDATTSEAGWHKVINVESTMPHSMLLKFHKVDVRWAAVVGYLEDGTSYLIGTNASGEPSIWRGSSDGTYEVVHYVPKSTPTVADVEIALRHIRFSDNDDDLWRCITLFMNDAMICTYIEKTSDLLPAPVYFGFAAPSGYSATYSNISVPQLTEFAETCTLDPSEAPIGGLGRAIEGRYIKMHMRHDGSVRAWRPRPVDSKRSFVAREILARNLPFDRRSIYNHVRQVGAYRQAEYVDYDQIKKEGHRFTELNNPFLMSEDECYEQARLSVLRMQSEANSQSITTPFTPLLQIEDRITTPDGDYVITQRDITIEQARIYQGIQAREYNEVGA